MVKRRKKRMEEIHMGMRTWAETSTRDLGGDLYGDLGRKPLPRPRAETSTRDLGGDLYRDLGRRPRAETSTQNLSGNLGGNLYRDLGGDLGRKPLPRPRAET